jgi:hypothetical protein
MPGTVIGKSLNLGYAGKVSRNGYNNITSRFSKSILDNNGNETMPSINFGDPVVLNTDNTYSKFGATGTGVSAATLANFAGFAVAEVKQVMSYGFGTLSSAGQYLPGQPMDVISSGSITAFCVEGTPVAGGAVYVATSDGTNVKAGNICATATPAGGATTVQLTNASWKTGKLDANNIAEVTLTSINRP